MERIPDSALQSCFASSQTVVPLGGRTDRDTHTHTHTERYRDARGVEGIERERAGVRPTVPLSASGCDGR